MGFCSILNGLARPDIERLGALTYREREKASLHFDFALSLNHHLAKLLKEDGLQNVDPEIRARVSRAFKNRKISAPRFAIEFSEEVRLLPQVVKATEFMRLVEDSADKEVLYDLFEIARQRRELARERDTFTLPEPSSRELFEQSYNDIVNRYNLLADQASKIFKTLFEQAGFTDVAIKEPKLAVLGETATDFSLAASIDFVCLVGKKDRTVFEYCAWPDGQIGKSAVIRELTNSGRIISDELEDQISDRIAGFLACRSGKKLIPLHSTSLGTYRPKISIIAHHTRENAYEILISDQSNGLLNNYFIPLPKLLESEISKALTNESCSKEVLPYEHLDDLAALSK